MVDLQYIKDFNEGKYSPIKDGDSITPDITAYLATLGPELIRGLIDYGDSNPPKITVNTEYVCPVCQKNLVHKTWDDKNLTRARNIMAKPHPRDVCSDCRPEVEKRWAKKPWPQLSNDDSDISDHDIEPLPSLIEYPPSEYFISTFLIPDQWVPYKTDDTPEEIADKVAAWAMAAEAEKPGAIRRHILKLDYVSEFLHTPYWRIVANRSKFRAHYCCEICGAQVRLAAHHRNYDRHGEEIFHPEDITCLCSTCHQLFHERLKKPHD